MKTINIYEAKTNLSKLLELVQAGENIVIAKAGKPIADLVPHLENSPVIFGKLKGKLTYNDKDFVGTDKDIQQLFYGKN